MHTTKVEFEWDEANKAAANFRKHGVRMPEAIPSLTIPAQLPLPITNPTQTNSDLSHSAWGRGLYVAGPKKCREFGVFLLSCAFHGPAETIRLTLSHRRSEIRRIMIWPGKLDLADHPVGLSMVPFALRYFPNGTEKFPWLHDCCTHNLPGLFLSNEEDCVGPRDEDWRNRDTIWIEAPNRGTIRLAELFLNAGCSWNPVREYSLEGDAGYRGVAPMSAEPRIFLPGSHGWIFDGSDV